MSIGRSSKRVEEKIEVNYSSWLFKPGGVRQPVPVWHKLKPHDQRMRMPSKGWKCLIWWLLVIGRLPGRRLCRERTGAVVYVGCLYMLVIAVCLWSW
jgi:hypothetical protein